MVQLYHIHELLFSRWGRGERLGVEIGRAGWIGPISKIRPLICLIVARAQATN